MHLRILAIALFATATTAMAVAALTARDRGLK